jgi:hypothetical protein
VARRFNGSSDFIVFTLSSVLQPLDAGPMTMAVLASVTSTTDGAFIHTRTSGGTNSWWMECASAQWNYGQGVAARDIGDMTTSEGWAIYAGHKGNGGAATPVGRKIILGGATTTVTAPSALADGTAPGAGGVFQVGKWGTASEFLGADIACCAVWDYELSDAEIDALATTFGNWSGTTTAPKWLVKFTQASPTDAVSDETGNGGGSATITGTTIVSDPAGFFSAGTTHSASAAVSTSASVTTAADSTKPVTAALTGTAAVTSAATSTKPVTSALTATATATSAAATTKPITSTLTASAGLTAAATSIKPATATLTTTATITASASIGAATVAIGASPVFTATVTPAAASSKPAGTSLAATASISSTAAAVKPSPSVLAATATISATVTSAMTATASVPLIASLTATASVTPAVTPITIRPNTGTTARSASGTTVRPFTGITVQP